MDVGTLARKDAFVHIRMVAYLLEHIAVRDNVRLARVYCVCVCVCVCVFSCVCALMCVY